MPKTRKYKEGTKIKSMCRICLTHSNNVMFKLVDQLTGDNYDAETYLEALEKVTSSQVDLNGHYPESICPMCVSFLKMCLEFITQYEKSQKRLQKMFKSDTPTYQSIELEFDSNDNPESDNEEDYLTEEIKYDPNDPLKVELIIKGKKFNLNEILVVEKEVKDTHDYKGFIKNLGKEISATIVSKKENHVNSENNISVLKVVSDEEEMQEMLKSNDENEEGEESIKFIVESNDEEEILNKIKIEQIDDQDNVEIEEHYTESDSQKSSDNDNLEYIEIDMYDKNSIESLIIDRTKLPDGGCDISTISTHSRRGKNREQTRDEFLKEVKFPCEVCKKVYQSRHSLKGHVKRAHMKQDQKPFTCEICGNVCRSRSAFITHKLKHFDKQFKCDLCDKAYTTKAHLKVHMTTHSNKRPFLCNVCGKDFNYANALTYHMRLHTGEKNYHCEYCPKRFRMINSLNRHVRTHTGEKPYKCQYCGRDFSSRGEVVCHEYTHTGYRPYHCKYCKKGFSKTHNLKIHLLSHGGPYHCQFCNKTFIEANILNMHNRISHKDLLNEEQMQEGTDEDSQDDTFCEFEGLSQDDSMSQDGNLKIESVEENSDME